MYAMKKSLIYLAVAACLAGCTNNKDKEEAENAKALAAATHEELVQAIQERDQLLDVMNDIINTTNDIKSAEGIVAINATGGEGGPSQAQVKSDLEAIKATLAERQKRLQELEASVKNSKSNNSKLLATIESLKTQIANQTAEIEQLQSQLATANQTIANLGAQVDTLTTNVQQVTGERDQAMAEATRQEDLANACYFAIGSKKELKEHNIIEGGGFLRKSKILPSDFDKSFFTQADKRTLTSIPLHSTKAKIITNAQPKDSYVIEDENGQKVLKITNPAQFWATSNYVVIQID